MIEREKLRHAPAHRMSSHGRRPEPDEGHQPRGVGGERRRRIIIAARFRLAGAALVEGDHRVVAGINLVTLLWSDGTYAIPCDYRLFDKPVDGLTKHEHVRAMLKTAHQRGFRPRLVAFDSWYSSLENLKMIRSLG